MVPMSFLFEWGLLRAFHDIYCLATQRVPETSDICLIAIFDWVRNI